jgi:serine/threonine protein kinase
LISSGQASRDRILDPPLQHSSRYRNEQVLTQHSILCFESKYTLYYCIEVHCRIEPCSIEDYRSSKDFLNICVASITLHQVVNHCYYKYIYKMEISAPIQLPLPHVYRAAIKTRLVYDSTNNTKQIVERRCLISESGRYYELGRLIRETIFGHIRHATALVPAMVGSVTCLIPMDPPAHVALKVYNRTKLEDLKGKTQENPVKEMATMEYIRQHGGHVNVIQLVECCADEERVYAIMEFCDGGDLFDLVKSGGAISEDKAIHYFRQVVLGLRYLHSLPLAHRDLSLENVLFTADGSCKIIDLGMCLRLPRNEATGQVLPIPAQGPCGKKNYMAPEVFDNANPFEPLYVDIWAIGAILYVLTVGAHPFHFANKLDTGYAMIVKGQLSKLLEFEGVNLSPALVDLLVRIFRENPTERISLDEILSHPWMKQPELNPLQ